MYRFWEKEQHHEKPRKQLGVKSQLNGFNIAFYPQTNVKSFLIVNMIQTWDSDMGFRHGKKGV